MKKHKTVDEFYAAADPWKAELAALRRILRSTQLEETLKWGAPVYTFGGKNVVGVGGFKSYFGLWFYQGALLADKRKVLMNAQEGTTRAMRQMRLKSKDEIDTQWIKAYIKEAVGLVEQGVEIKPQRNKPLPVPEELQAALTRRAKAKTRFQALTPGKRREYADYVASAKREDTRLKRVARVLPMIESGIGLNDKYRNC